MAALLAYSGHASGMFQNPESQIIIVEKFLPPESSDKLIRFYNRSKQNLSKSSDNQVEFNYSTDPRILEMVSGISKKVLGIMKKRYGINASDYHIDHCSMYARIEGNSCSYHADNITFFCPVHGRDQSYLRAHCDGSCQGATYMPNHTPWREFTALLYLNDDFEGGEIVFEDGPYNQLYRKIIPMRANTLVVTPNGKDFYHEVLTVRKGTRYSLHIWYTSDPRYRHPLFR